MCALIAYEKALTEFERYHEKWPPISWKVARRLRLFVITSTVTFRDISQTERFVSVCRRHLYRERGFSDPSARVKYNPQQLLR